MADDGTDLGWYLAQRISALVMAPLVLLHLGPAALNRAWTLVNDVRDQAGADRLRAVAGSGGCYRCHAQSGCSTHCPNALDPTAAIAGLKRAATRAAVRGRG